MLMGSSCRQAVLAATSALLLASIVTPAPARARPLISRPSLDTQAAERSVQAGVRTATEIISQPVHDVGLMNADIPEVLECHLMAGEADYLLRVVCRDPEDFERLHRRLAARLPGVARLHSNMSIREVKARQGLPV